MGFLTTSYQDVGGESNVLNRRYATHPPNGKFWCWHKWEPSGIVGPDWDIVTGLKVPAVCRKCRKMDQVSTSHFREWPDSLIDPHIRYM